MEDLSFMRGATPPSCCSHNSTQHIPCGSRGGKGLGDCSGGGGGGRNLSRTTIFHFNKMDDVQSCNTLKKMI